MALACELYERRFQTEWRVVVPEVGDAKETCCISPENNDWHFRFESRCASEQDESWEILFSRRGKRCEFQDFRFIVYVRSKDGRRMFMCHKEICEHEDENVQIWSESRNSLFKKYPAVDFSENALKFIFIFEMGILSHRQCHSEDKSAPTRYLDDRLCLESLALDIGKLMDDGSDPDVRLKCGDCTISAHKLILGARSEVFRTMLHSDMKEGREGAVEVVDMEPEVFQTFIRYLYTGHLPELSNDTILPLYEAGDKYHVNALTSRCSELLAEHLTRDAACEMLAIADAHSDEVLKRRVISYILDENIPNDEDVWPEFCNSNLKLAFEVLSRAYKQFICSR